MTDWGSVADWVSASATVAALLAASYAARVAYRQLRVLEDQEEYRQRAEKIRDASRVAVWVRIDAMSALPELRYVNASGMPIYDLVLWVATPEQTFTIVYVVDGPSAESKTMVRGTDDLQRQICESTYRPGWTQLLESGHLVCAAAFRDSVNRRWFRDFHGRLSEVEEQEDVGTRFAAHRVARFPRDSDTDGSRHPGPAG
ncbi:hypothetical protein [Pseudonocardia broussonetiae]|uniref:Uncharacterized protein n=1 Tax=Pseudonocardia broussonetiae TaxID=2736640 RepID=A0A6M6JRY6_9PSEU|nr:hypothetical protein [Pseudonocardia broussonetiae]QJY50110.1 hypothetical protein HOP40_33705 [Pseudonocardia broussonetiae]